MHILVSSYYTYSFVNDLPEDGLEGPNHIGGTSQNNKSQWLHVQLAGLNTVQKFGHDSVNIYRGLQS